ncbi:apolipoprotein N-acyltransferase [Sneathiella sp.]|jgi:apolipoprotein N-acyltransferase|uniref:apolipoprotein N-acyltransferase n=1 Tax=Sneathiella sp. TaxID=1964365 RepID=UPI0039E6C531
MTNLLSRFEKLAFWKIAALSFILGLLFATTFAPLHLVFLLPVCFSAILFLLGLARTKKQAFFVGWWFGWGQFIAGFYWIGVAFTIDANAHAALIPLPVMALPAFLALFPGLATLGTFLLRWRTGPKILAFSSLWILAEYVRGTIFTGFPWNLTGYSWGNILPMLQWSAFVGIFGLGLLTVLISSIPVVLTDAAMPQKDKNRAMLFMSALLGIMILTGYWRLGAETPAPLTNSAFRIVQPNIRQADKWVPKLKGGHVKKLADLSKLPAKGQIRHLIWPETAVPFFLTTDQPIQSYLDRVIPEGGSLTTGAPRKDPEKRQYWNSVQVLQPGQGVTGIYDKQHLVPYGEYLPFRTLLIESGLSRVIPVLDTMSDFSAGVSGSQTVTLPGLPTARVLICYEVAFPWEVSGADDFSWILNATNDGWFGNTSGPYQHLVMTKTRAIEQGMSVIRAANTGISAVIDGYGRVLQSLPLNEPGILDGNIPAPLASVPLYKRAGEILPASLLCLFLIVGLFWQRRPSTE